jgi:hypothetical protein
LEALHGNVTPVACTLLYWGDTEFLPSKEWAWQRYIVGNSEISVFKSNLGDSVTFVCRHNVFKRHFEDFFQISVVSLQRESLYNYSALHPSQCNTMKNVINRKHASSLL